MILIVGRSGSGKDYLAQEFIKRGLTKVKSYSTRQPRFEGEDTYNFISPEEAAKITDKFAPAMIKGCEYFSTKSQIQSKDIYIIEPNGVYDLLEGFPEMSFIICYLKAPEQSRLSAAMSRGDAEREKSIFAKRTADEDERFTAFEKVLDTPELFTDFCHKYPNFVTCFEKVNDYKPETMEELASLVMTKVRDMMSIS